jgi:hypothetical protein
MRTLIAIFIVALMASSTAFARKASHHHSKLSRAKDAGLTWGMGGAAAFNHAAATPNRAVRMAARCGVGQTA